MTQSHCGAWRAFPARRDPITFVLLRIALEQGRQWDGEDGLEGREAISGESWGMTGLQGGAQWSGQAPVS